MWQRFFEFDDEAIEKMDPELFNGLVQREALVRDRNYRLERFIWSPIPPEDDTCLDCFVWCRFDAPLRHFGYTWKRKCDLSCVCRHHQDAA